MPESVDRPAPEMTSARPSASRPASAETPPTVAGAAVTAPWSLPEGRCARSSAGGDRTLQPLHQRPMDAGQALRGEGALEEAADAAGPVPGGARPHRAHAGVS